MSKQEQIIRQSLENGLSLPCDAVNYLCDVWHAIQFFDDIQDGDAVETSDISRALWSLMVGIPQNPFYVKNSYRLSSNSAVQILKWNAANDAEAAGDHDERSFMWRAGFYDLVLDVVLICHGHEKIKGVEKTILGLYGDSYTEYSEEF